MDVVAEAIDGEEAVNMATAERPDLIIMDIQLPKMNGLEATRKLRQLPDSSHTPIIAITAYAMKGDREKLLAAGCDAYLSKPINTRELPKVISEMLFPPPKYKSSSEGDNGEPEDSSH